MRSARVTLLILCKHLRVSHLEYFFSKISKLFLRKRRNIRTTKCNSCRNVCTYIILQPISRKRKRGRSVFIEMFARALFVPMKACLSVLPRFFFLLSFSKEGRKMRKNMFKVYAKYPSYTNIKLIPNSQIKCNL